MDTKLLEDALILLEEGNLSRAAARRNVTQPAFSRRIRALEEWAGVQLLDRRANRIRLSANFEENVEEIRSVVSHIDKLRRILEGRSSSRNLIFATQHALAVSIFPGLQNALQKFSPFVGWRLRTMNREDCVSLFLRAEADMLMIYEARGFPPLPFDETVSRHVWMHDTLIPVCGGSLRHSIGAEGRFDEILPLIRYPGESHFGRLIEQSRLEEKLEQRKTRVVIESAFTSAVVSLVRNGAGIGWVPHSMCRQDLMSGDLISLSNWIGHIPLAISLFVASSNQPVADLLSRLSEHG